VLTISCTHHRGFKNITPLFGSAKTWSAAQPVFLNRRNKDRNLALGKFLLKAAADKIKPVTCV
jgi:hypothetical protein